MQRTYYTGLNWATTFDSWIISAKCHCYREHNKTLPITFVEHVNLLRLLPMSYLIGKWDRDVYCLNSDCIERHILRIVRNWEWNLYWREWRRQVEQFIFTHSHKFLVLILSYETMHFLNSISDYPNVCILMSTGSTGLTKNIQKFSKNVSSFLNINTMLILRTIVFLKRAIESIVSSVPLY